MIRILTFAAIAALSFAQSPVRPEFEAAVIKLNNSCAAGGRGGGRTTPGRVALECAELRDLILTAYEIYGGSARPDSFRMQVLGGPPWIDSDRYDFELKAEGNPPAAQMYGPMLRSLLEERFHLKVHRETREAPVYLLTEAKGGAKLKRSAEGGCVTAKSNQPPGQAQLAVCGSVGDLAAQLGLRLDRNVIDRTGFTGIFDIHLEISQSELRLRQVAGGSLTQGDSPANADLSGPSIFTAVEQQLGLKLEPGKGPVSVLVIDQIERPSAN
ncbi:MAG TPA: TIGR03435 family protein [Bryobacteraceae bacterium]|nr:TIGR03435 family protein [Bryobacteraceae bacterium]